MSSNLPAPSPCRSRIQHPTDPECEWFVDLTRQQESSGSKSDFSERSALRDLSPLAAPYGTACSRLAEEVFREWGATVMREELAGLLHRRDLAADSTELEAHDKGVWVRSCLALKYRVYIQRHPPTKQITGHTKALQSVLGLTDPRAICGHPMCGKMFGAKDIKVSFEPWEWTQPMGGLALVDGELLVVDEKFDPKNTVEDLCLPNYDLMSQPDSVDRYGAGDVFCLQCFEKLLERPYGLPKRIKIKYKGAKTAESSGVNAYFSTDSEPDRTAKGPVSLTQISNTLDSPGYISSTPATSINYSTPATDISFSPIAPHGTIDTHSPFATFRFENTPSVAYTRCSGATPGPSAIPCSFDNPGSVTTPGPDYTAARKNNPSISRRPAASCAIYSMIFAETRNLAGAMKLAASEVTLINAWKKRLEHEGALMLAKNYPGIIRVEDCRLEMEGYEKNLPDVVWLKGVGITQCFMALRAK